MTSIITLKEEEKVYIEIPNELKELQESLRKDIR